MDSTHLKLVLSKKERGRKSVRLTVRASLHFAYAYIDITVQCTYTTSELVHFTEWPG